MRPRFCSWDDTEASRRRARSVVDRLQVRLKWHPLASVAQGHVIPGGSALVNMKSRHGC